MDGFQSKVVVSEPMDPEEAGFHAVLDANWNDQTARAALADWYEDHPTEKVCVDCIQFDLERLARLKTVSTEMKPNPKCRACGGSGSLSDTVRPSRALGYRAMAVLGLAPERLAADSCVWWDNMPGEGFCPVEWYQAMMRRLYHKSTAEFSSRREADNALADSWMFLPSDVRERLLKKGNILQLGLDGLPLEAGLRYDKFVEGEPVPEDHPIPDHYQAVLDRMPKRRLP